MESTLTDVPYQMTVVGAFAYVCENLWKRAHVYNAVHYNVFFPVDNDDHVIMELQCIHLTLLISP